MTNEYNNHLLFFKKDILIISAHSEKNVNLSMFLSEKRKRPGQRRMAWSAPTEIKETRRAGG
ncbi:hypothetical protein BABA_24110, partial [Neobacillus bataviensis LMG 21833]